MRKWEFLLGAASVAVASVAAPSTVYAQTAPADAAETATGQGDEIVVTARRREESIVDVPISIAAYSSQAIQDKGMSNVSTVAQMTPGLQFDRGATAGDIRPSLRGIALIEGRSNVAIIVDGIDVTGVSLNTTIGGGGSQTSATLMDLERIEVVKGPQTVYFGRSAFAGAIQFISKDPSFNTGGSIQGSIGNYGRRELSANITGPVIGDTVAAKLTATYRDFNGFYKNPGNGMGLGGSEVWGVGGSALVRSGAFRGRFSLNYLHEHSTPIAAYVIPRADVTQFGVNKITSADFNPSLIGISSNIDYKGNLAKTWRGVANMEYDLGDGWSVHGISGLNKVKSTDQYDFDTKTANTPSGTALAGGLLNCLPGTCVGIGDFDGDLQQLSQEIRLNYDADTMRFLIGGYLFDENFKQLDYTRFVGSQAFVTGSRAGITPRLATLRTNTYSAFGSAEGDWGDLTVTGELRFNHEVIRAAAATSFNILFQSGSTAVDFRGRQSFDSWLPRLSAKYKLGTNSNLYASVAKGSKPGGFNVGQVRDDLRPFAQESVWTYELGAKGRVLDGLLTFDASLYYSDWKNVQVTTICYGTASPFGPEAQCPAATAVSLNYIVNADKARVKGAELGLVVKPSRDVSLNFNYAYADSKFKDFLARDVFPAPASPTPRQFGGNRMPLIPKHSLSGSARIEHPVADEASAFVEVSGRYRSSRYARFDNRVLIGSKAVADAQFGLKGDSWTALFFIDNVFNNKTPDFTRYYGNFNPSIPNGEFIAAPAKRAMGIRVSKNF
jgi:iron complex outermembrane recepter protein